MSLSRVIISISTHLMTKWFSLLQMATSMDGRSDIGFIDRLWNSTVALHNNKMNNGIYKKKTTRNKWICLLCSIMGLNFFHEHCKSSVFYLKIKSKVISLIFGSLKKKRIYFIAFFNNSCKIYSSVEGKWGKQALVWPDR